ncbi:hypothetical protein TeGR_g9809 [Tetraparma gracilis]|uniref:Uncharacterized protein n=1 Tax=Tetraparma gracilis TaxID=2962635 RepID=A0ABQ6N3M9_9STRA|nr:hypothetical protein TeGR_g9809 [Tetraparma gracilis]
MPGESGAPALDLENYKKFYGFGIPKWSPYYYVTGEDDKNNAETIRKFKEEGGGALPRFQTHEELKNHLIHMSDTELNRMRDFGCGKPHWSPYYVDAAYEHESRAIPGDKTSMAMTVPIRGEEGYASPRASQMSSARRSEGGSQPASRQGSKPPSRMSEAPVVPQMKMPDPMADTFAGKVSSRKTTARSMTTNRSEARRIEDLLKKKEMEISALRDQLAATKGGK